MSHRRLRPLHSLALVLTLLLALSAGASPASAASISYGSFGPVPPGVAFADVVESSGTDPVPLYGPPTAFATGLDFDPTGFVATGSGGAQDVTDGQLNITLTANPLVAITVVTVSESGDFTLSGSGTAATQASAGAILRVIVTQIDGVNVAPIPLIPVNASVTFNLAANPGVVQPWSLGVSLNIAGQLGPDQRATQLELVIDNQLLAFSEASSVAFVAKKDFTISLETLAVPEPGTLSLLLGGCLLLPAVARRRG